MSQTHQQDWDDFMASVGEPEKWVWVCEGCGKQSVLPKSRKRAQRRAEGHQVECRTTNQVHIEPVNDD